MPAELSACENWAYEEFGHARLGRLDRTRRLTLTAARFAERPGGIVAAAFSRSKEREGAYRFMESEHIDPKVLAEAAFRATVTRCNGSELAFVPVDGSSLQVRDPRASKGTGRVGAHIFAARGFHVMSAMAVTADGVPQGLCGQAWWSRSKPVTRNCNKRKVTDKETKHWLEVIKQVRGNFAGSSCRPWFQLDRGGDAWPVLREAHDSKSWMTVRASHDRRVSTDEAGERQYLWKFVEDAPPIGLYSVAVPKTAKREARTAVLTVQALEVTLNLRDYRTKSFRDMRIWAVRGKETRESADAEEPLEWMLLTTFPAETFEAACTALFGYTQRWRIEEFHKAWKSGLCETEKTQLQSESAIHALAIILSSVATRLLRMTYLARVTPDAPASVEFTSPEIRAAGLLTGRRRVRTQRVSLATMILWVATIGGYTGRSAGGPPGMIVLGRGLERVTTVASALRTQAGMEVENDPGGSG
jgi:hypothetical protein